MVAKKTDKLAAATPTQLTTVTYNQSDVYEGLNPATYADMNDGTADGSKDATGANAWQAGSYVRASLGATYWVDSVRVGYDYLDNLGADLGQSWGTAALNGAFLSGSTDGQDHTAIATLPVYETLNPPVTNGLVTIPVGGQYAFLRITTAGQWLAVTEFEVWVVGGPIDLGGDPDMETVVVNPDWSICTGANYAYGRYDAGATVSVPVPIGQQMTAWGSVSPG